jgi:dihydropteroate synthase
MFRNYASYIDVGAESTRPGATPLTLEDEWQRLQPVLSSLGYAHPSHVSIDTYHPETIERAFSSLGSFIINDVTGFNNPRMVELAAKYKATCIVSHLPQTMGQDIQRAHRERDQIHYGVDEVRDELMMRYEHLKENGVESVILDPGIGFGKTMSTNWELLSFAKEVPGIPVMIGYSKKTFLGEHKGELEPNLEAGRIAVDAGAKYLRLHADLLAAHYAEFCA